MYFTLIRIRDTTQGLGEFTCFVVKIFRFFYLQVDSSLLACIHSVCNCVCGCYICRQPRSMSLRPTAIRSRPGCCSTFRRQLFIYTCLRCIKGPPFRQNSTILLSWPRILKTQKNWRSCYIKQIQ